jgi:hypothetical protein
VCVCVADSGYWITDHKFTTRHAHTHMQYQNPKKRPLPIRRLPEGSRPAARSGRTPSPSLSTPGACFFLSLRGYLGCRGSRWLANRHLPGAPMRADRGCNLHIDTGGSVLLQVVNVSGFQDIRGHPSCADAYSVIISRRAEYPPPNQHRISRIAQALEYAAEPSLVSLQCPPPNFFVCSQARCNLRPGWHLERGGSNALFLASDHGTA